MNKETKSKIKNMVLTLREMFEKEVEIGLNKYGIYVDKEWKDGRSLRHLSKEDMNDKKRVEAFIKRQEAAGLSILEATKEFIKETSYTWINRFVGLKCMETRGLIEGEVITTREEFGGRSKRHRDYRDAHPEVAHSKDEGLIACLMEVFEEVTEEIKILFDPKNEYSLIIPRYPVLKEAIELINNSVGYDAYKEDEMLGWVYQYFQEREKDRIFEEVRTKKKKISGSDIIPATSLYTEKYMVRFLVENSLGAIWMEMYPQSNLYKNWEYFVKDPNNTTREPKQVKKITFLDPACGSGHFLLYAFDVFYQMYKEEGEVPEDEIPEYILKYNLHGIDIDLRSIQLSALGLWLKAKSKNKNVEIGQMNLVAANAIMLNGDRLNDFLSEFGSDELAKDLVKTIWRGLQNIRELGSLLKVEEQIDEIIERRKKQLRISKEWEEGQFTWNKWKQQIMDKLRKYYEKSAETFDINKQMFANETIKGISFIDLISQKYDVVATNPPYVNTKNMGEGIKKSVWKFYPKSKHDLYSCFMERNLEFTINEGFTSIVTQQSFMFTSRFQKVREIILNNRIKLMAHIGAFAFLELGDHVIAVLSILVRSSKKKKSVFIKVPKNIRQKNIYLKNINKDNLYILNQDKFKLIDKCPFIFWLSSNLIINTFASFPPFKETLKSRQGMATGNNDKFLRFFWEIEKQKLEDDSKWVTYIKGGISDKWYGGHEIVINWSNDGENVKSYIMSRPFFIKHNFSLTSVMCNQNYYFKEGITYSLLGSFFSCRVLPKNCIFDVGGVCLFPNIDQKSYLLGFLNSTLVKNFMQTLNPTLNYQVGDVDRIPYKSPTLNKQKSVSNIVKYCVNIKKSLLQFVINDCEFKQTALIWGKEQMGGMG